MYEQKPLIIWLDENEKVITTFSDYEISNGMISFNTRENKITIPVSKIIKIKEEKQ